MCNKLMLIFNDMGLSEAWEGFYGLHATLMKTRHSENPKENRAWFLNNVPPHWGLL